ncbi:MAG TPA: hypothetical protein VNX28_07190, partial [Gemmataceae bacterium]|nr:hypothetical protein [Gemmataceae bacterium]
NYDPARIAQLFQAQAIPYIGYETREERKIRGHRLTFAFPDDCWRADCESFLRAIRDPNRFGNGQDGLEGLRMTAAAHASMDRGGEPIVLDSTLSGFGA